MPDLADILKHLIFLISSSQEEKVAVIDITTFSNEGHIQSSWALSVSRFNEKYGNLF